MTEDAKCGGGPYRTDGGRKMNIAPHDGDPVREAINRAEWAEYLGFAEVEGHDVLVHARISDIGIPELDVYAGGEFDGEIDEYVGGLTYTVTFDRLWSLDDKLAELFRDYDLKQIGGDRSVDTGTSQGANDD